MRKISLYFLGVLLLSMNLLAKEGDGLRYLPVQDGGRVKPYDTFAREVLELVYGKSVFEGKPAYQIVLTWMLSPQAWTDKAIFEVRNAQVLKNLSLDEKSRWYQPKQIFENGNFQTLMQELQAKRESKEKFNPYFQALQRLENQFFIFQEIALGRMLKVLPSAEGESWVSVAELSESAQQYFIELNKAFVSHIAATASGNNSNDLGKLGNELDVKVQEFIRYAQTIRPNYFDSGRIQLEVFYYDFHPFRWAYIFYLIAAIILLFVWVQQKEKFQRLAWGAVLLGLFFHTAGFVVRVYLAERPPVSNMYETVIWVAWGAVVFSLILEAIYRFRFILLAGSLVGLFSLIVADYAPAILDPSIQPLEAVLRSNYWLVVHVMTITISYAAFFLAFILGDITLLQYLLGEEKNREKIKALTLSIYRSVQLGVVFLAPGIILGGVWADESWGRFWGWDPKETWALIVLLGYIAVLHGRLTNWIREFGMACSAVLAFNLVIMAWYGVNFVLGAGLHSYGFGAGGVEYVSIFVGLHFLYVIYVFVFRRGQLSSKN